ncbi:hypothetical protein OnM2_072051 [Erysiphe neolycopersici]|uniref:Uncharacterized protein n=1 Tax=Erysiphe neolycopersici TaxID=212602 RepID=A0A420HK46_9PEZI|nr:hypothetical protein OnM2_072051 [Erysiphe neolycopersici]
MEQIPRILASHYVSHPPKKGFPDGQKHHKQIIIICVLIILSLFATLNVVALGVYLYRRIKKRAAPQSRDVEDASLAHMTGETGGTITNDNQIRELQEIAPERRPDVEGEAPPPYTPLKIGMPPANSGYGQSLLSMLPRETMLPCKSQNSGVFRAGKTVAKLVTTTFHPVRGNLIYLTR